MLAIFLPLLKVAKSPKILIGAIVAIVVVAVVVTVLYYKSKSEKYMRISEELNRSLSQEKINVTTYRDSYQLTFLKLEVIRDINNRLQATIVQNDATLERLKSKLKSYDFQNEAKKDDGKASEFITRTYKDAITCLESATKSEDTSCTKSSL
jgi:hypothetical protein